LILFLAASVDQKQPAVSNVPTTNRDSEQKTPCRHGEQCRDTNDPNHCRKYSHPIIVQPNNPASTPCRHSSKCTDRSPDHLTKFSHPLSCKSNPKCHDQSADHREKFWHPTPCRHNPNCRDKSVIHREAFSH